MRKIALVGLEGAYHSSLAALLDLCELANRYAMALYEPVDGVTWATRTKVLTPDGGPARFADGRALTADGALDPGEIHDIVLLPGFEADDEAELTRRLSACASLCAWLRRQRAGGAWIGASGASVFILAEAGLIGAPGATVHWRLERAFRRRWPKVRLDPARALVAGEGVICAAGLGADPALALRLLETAMSKNLAEVLSRQTGVDAHPDEAAGTSVPAGEVLREDLLVGRAQLWLQQRFSQKAGIAELAEAMAVSPRTLARRFQASLGMTPQAYLQHLRVEAAKNMLVKSNRRVERIAFMVGYADAGFFKRLFRERTGVTPAAWRAAGRASRQR